MGFLGQILGPFMSFCYNLTKNYGLAIILFTLISKFILLPISVWVQKNSITMVKIEPEVNRIKIKHFGDKDTIAEEQQKLYKKEHYNPLASLVPLIAQIVLLMGVVEVIYHPLDCLVARHRSYGRCLLGHCQRVYRLCAGFEATRKSCQQVRLAGHFS